MMLVSGRSRMSAIRAAYTGDKAIPPTADNNRSSQRQYQSSRIHTQRGRLASEKDTKTLQQNAKPSQNKDVFIQPAVWVDAQADKPVSERQLRANNQQASWRQPVQSQSRSGDARAQSGVSQQQWGQKGASQSEQPEGLERLGPSGRQQPEAWSARSVNEYGRGNQSGVHEEQPATSGRGEPQSTGTFRSLFTSRKLRGLWSRKDERETQQKEGNTSRRSTFDYEDNQQAKARQAGSPEDDWAANEVALQEDDDGWGGSRVNKWKAPPSKQRPLPRSQLRQGVNDFDDEESSWEGSVGLGPKHQNFSEENTTGRDSTDAQAQSPYSMPDTSEAQSGYETQRAESQIQEALEAEILEGEDDWQAAEEEWEEGSLPDITPLAQDEADELLPIIPTPDQMGESWGGAVDFGQRAAAALALTIVVAKFNLVLLATGSATFVFWGPVLGAANRNRILRSSGRYVGLWRALVKDVQIELPERRPYGGRQSYTPLRGNPILKLLVGDQSGARSLLILPYNKRYEAIQVGEAAEVLVLSSQSNFNKFKALKEIYLPESGLWMSDYPHVNRHLFLEISLDIERERKMTMAEGAFEVPA